MVFGIIIIFIGASIPPAISRLENEHINQILSRDIKDSKDDSWWNVYWTYKKELSISNASSDYQMQIQIWKEDGYDDAINGIIDCEDHCNNNFSDIRFVDSNQTSLLPYWIENISSEGGDHYVIIWVKTSGEDSIYLYYGNSNASLESNGNETFIFFDDFNNFDEDIWDEYDQNDVATISAEDGLLHIAFGDVSSGSSAGALTNETVAVDGLVVAKLKGERGSNDLNIPLSLSARIDYPSNKIDNIYRHTKRYFREFTSEGISHEDQYCSDSYPALEWRVFYIKKLQDWQGAGAFSDFYNGVRLGDESLGDYTINDAFYLVISARTFNDGLDCYCDWIFVAKYDSVEPTWSAFYEESAHFPDIVYVDDDYDENTSGWGYDHFDSIQDGVDAVNVNGTVYVYNGTYYENIDVDKTINLTGEDRNSTIIDGGGSGDVVYVSADLTYVSGFTVQNSGIVGYPNYDAGVEIRSNYSIIIGNIVKGNNRGIWISANNNSVVDNEIISNNAQGIEIYLSRNNSIVGNNVSSNTKAGIQSDDSSNNTITSNKITLNSWHGIFLDDFSGSNTITCNNISNNDNGICIFDSSDSNVIYHNNFINNSMNANDECDNTWDDGYPSGGNYWDDYIGNDSDGDCIGDTPYNISGGDNQDLYPFMYPNGWINNPPCTPYDPLPFDGATNAPISGFGLNWTGCDPDPCDSLTFDVYFGIITPPPKVASNITQGYNTGTLDYSTKYYWQIVAWDNHGASTEGPIWGFTTAKPLEPDLYCTGSFSWTDMIPGAMILDFFNIRNIGEPESLLDWKITGYPDWGEWNFTQSSGEDLTPEDGAYTIGVIVVVPEKYNTVFTGTIILVNTENTSDYCTIDVTLATPKNKPFLFDYPLLSWLIERFPLLQQLLNALGVYVV